jgi:DNA invertase Pin-like site-specific DNA recombinase
VARQRKTPADPAIVFGYQRCSTQEQADSGAGLAAQRAAIEAECARRGWTLAKVFEDAGASAKTLNGRPGLSEAIAALEAGEAAALVVAKLDRLSRSVRDFADLMERATRQGWALVVLDLGIDMSTPAGEAMANVLATFAQLERRLIGQRTKDALAVRRNQGVRLGRPTLLDPKVSKRIVDAHQAGGGWSEIARRLDADGVRTAQGGKHWYPASVRAVYLSAKKRAAA